MRHCSYFDTVTQPFFEISSAIFFILSYILKILLAFLLFRHACYNVSVIFMISSDILEISPAIFEVSSHVTVTQPFCYRDSVILRFYQLFFFILSDILEISLAFF
jgi:formylmethanofuran dehydrogenase subunit E-like metal-binding protein